MPRGRSAICAFLLALACSAISAPMPARAAESLEFGGVGGPAAVIWPLYIGTAKGLFAAADLTIKLVFVPSSAGLQQQVAAGALPIADGGLNDQVRAIFEGAPMALVRLEGQVPPYTLVAQPAIKSIAELRGKSIIVGGTKDITLVYLERMLEPNGLKHGDYDLVYAGATIARFSALQSGAVSAAVLYPPYDFHAEAAGFTNLGLVVDFAPNLPFTGIAANTGWARQNKARLEKFLAAYGKAVAWFNDDRNRGEAVRILVEASHQDQGDIEKSYDFFRKIRFFQADGKVSKKAVGAIIDTLRSDLGDKPLDINRLFLPGVTRVTE